MARAVTGSYPKGQVLYSSYQHGPQAGEVLSALADFQESSNTGGLVSRNAKCRKLGFREGGYSATDSVTSMLPRVALEYGQTSWPHHGWPTLGDLEEARGQPSNHDRKNRICQARAEGSHPAASGRGYAGFRERVLSASGGIGWSTARGLGRPRRGIQSADFARCRASDERIER